MPLVNIDFDLFGRLVGGMAVLQLLNLGLKLFNFLPCGGIDLLERVNVPLHCLVVALQGVDFLLHGCVTAFEGIDLLPCGGITSSKCINLLLGGLVALLKRVDLLLRRVNVTL